MAVMPSERGLGADIYRFKKRPKAAEDESMSLVSGLAGTTMGAIMTESDAAGA